LAITFHPNSKLHFLHKSPFFALSQLAKIEAAQVQAECAPLTSVVENENAEMARFVFSYGPRSDTSPNRR
jgi:hypothetical protein